MRSLLDAYRTIARSARTGTASPRAAAFAATCCRCLEEWAGQPFFFAAGDPFRSQALWSFAHGMVILEIDGRYPDDSDLDRTWEAGAAAFERP